MFDEERQVGTEVSGAAVLEGTASPEKGWDARPVEPENLSSEDRGDWLDIRATVRMLAAEEGWSMGEVARKAGIPHGTFSPWYAGKYRGVIPEVTAKLKVWLRADEERRTMVAAIVEPGFVRTPTAVEVLEALLVAQELPGIAVIHLAAGMGKTICIRHAMETRPHVFSITASPSVRTVPALNREIATRLDILGFHSGRLRSLIGQRLVRAGRNTLLIVDEAQNLGDDAVDELRHYRDEWGCGLALVGNHDVINRWGAAKPKDGYGQLHRRITIRVNKARPSAEDITAFAGAWGIADPEALALMRAIGAKPGALGQITETVKLAAIRARGAKRALKGEDVRWAWNRRADVGGLS